MSLVPLHHIRDHEQHDTIIGEIQAPHKHHTCRDLDRQQEIEAHALLCGTHAVESAEKRKQEECKRRLKTDLHRRERQRIHLFQKGIRSHRHVDLVLRQAEKCGQNGNNECVVGIEQSVYLFEHASLCRTQKSLDRHSVPPPAIVLIKRFTRQESGRQHDALRRLSREDAVRLLCGHTSDAAW